jgi:glycosyltransferase involved in cell wall biosynthesis
MGAPLTTPTVSVILPVYHGAADVPAAIRSILDQDFEDFELIVIDDGSFKDDSRTVLRQVAAETGDPRLRVVELPKNIGLAAALNHGICLARGRYIARQDQDDISKPGRLAAQVRHLEANSDCALVGTRAEIWIGDQATGRVHDHPTEDGVLKFDLLWNNPFVHASVMFRREVTEVIGVYSTDPIRQPPEDYEYWSRVARRYGVANIPERLVIYRETPSSMSRQGPNPFLDRLLLIAAENLAHWNGLTQPDGACNDAVALLNAAHDRLSPGADIGAISARVARAGETIAALSPSAGLAARRADAELALRHHYMLARGLTPVLHPLLHFWRKLPLSARVRRGVKRLILR